MRDVRRAEKCLEERCAAGEDLDLRGDGRGVSAGVFCCFLAVWFWLIFGGLVCH